MHGVLAALLFRAALALPGSCAQASEVMPEFRGAVGRATPGQPWGAADRATLGQPWGAADRATPGRPREAADRATPGQPWGAADRATPGRPREAVGRATPGQPWGAADRATPGQPWGAADRATPGQPWGAADRATPGRPREAVGNVMPGHRGAVGKARPGSLKAAAACFTAAALAAAVLCGCRETSRTEIIFQKKGMEQEMATGKDKDYVNIIVATDLHYLASELTDHGEMFRNIVENADGKVMMYSEELVDAFLAQVLEKEPDVLILSGDLTFNGERLSHEKLAAGLKRLEEAGILVLVLPGNHDLNSGGAVRFEGDGFEYVDNLKSDEFEEVYGELGIKYAIATDEASHSFAVEPVKGLRILMLDVNTANRPGIMTDETLRWLHKQLEDTVDCGARVITVTHQNITDHNSLISYGFTINNAEAVRECLAGYPVVCNLSGHIHMQHMAYAEMDNGDGSVSGIWDIATSSLAVSPNQYGVITVTDEGLSYRTECVDVSRWAAESGLLKGNVPEKPEVDAATDVDDESKEHGAGEDIAAGEDSEGMYSGEGAAAVYESGGIGTGEGAAANYESVGTGAVEGSAEVKGCGTGLPEELSEDAWQEERNTVLLNFSEYSREFFMDICRRQVLTLLGEDTEEGTVIEEESNRDSGVELMAEYFAELNVAYFGGRTDLLDEEYYSGIKIGGALAEEKASSDSGYVGSGKLSDSIPVSEELRLGTNISTDGVQRSGTSISTTGELQSGTGISTTGELQSGTSISAAGELWAESGTFLASYISSILEEEPHNYCELDISY